MLKYGKILYWKEIRIDKKTSNMKKFVFILKKKKIKLFVSDFSLIIHVLTSLKANLC